RPQRRYRCLSESGPKAIVSKKAGVPIATVARCENDVDHLPGGHEVNVIAPACALRLGQLFEEEAHWLSKKSSRVLGNHSVAVELGEQPVRSPLDRDPRFTPEA